MSDKPFNLRTAAKQKPVQSRRPDKPFRLAEIISLSASDRYNDPYDCDITARKMRDRFVLSLNLTCAPVTNRVFSKTWIFEDMETCWSKFHIVKDIVTDIRDFIEVEGLKSVIFQYMLKHSLSAISADVENIYETSNPNARTVIDESTRGNLIKNFPTLPFMSQSGPDELDSVYSAVGNAPNPVPPDGIKGESQLAHWQHERKEKGLKDVLPSPISKFQEAAGILPSMFKGAASGGVVKTASEEKDESAEFVEKISKSSNKAKLFGKKLAIKHYMEMAGSDEAEAEAFYNGVRAACSNCNLVLNLSPSAVAQFLTEGEYVPIFENSELEGRFNHYATKREQVEKVLGCSGLSPAYASVTFLAEGDRGYGKCGLTLEDVEDSTVLLCGDSFRVRNASRPDFADDPELILYDYEDLADCKACSTICAMSVGDLAGGPALALSKVLEPGHEFGRCEALIFKKITPENVSRIVAASEKDAKTVRKILAKIGRIVPVIESDVTPKIVSIKDEDDEKNAQGVDQQHFKVGDRVALKPMASHPKMLGTIVGLSQAGLTIEWDDKNRSVYDMSEALMRVMGAPSEPKRGNGMVVYSLPGMDGDTAQVLSGAGIDPVTLYALASHYKPASPSIGGWLDNLIKALEHMGIRAHKVSGYTVAEDGEEAFRKRDWLESKLASGARLVMDIDPRQILIKAGDLDDYVLPDPQPKIVIE